MTNNNNDKNKITNAMDDFLLAKQKIQETIENLNKTFKNLTNTKKNFENYQKITKENAIKYSPYGEIQTFDERASFLDHKFNFCLIDYDSIGEIILIEPMEKS